MRKIYEILRLLWACNLSMRATARSCRVARSTVKEYQVRARAAGLERWEDVNDLDEVTLERLLFRPPPAQGTPRPLPSWATVHEELQAIQQLLTPILDPSFSDSSFGYRPRRSAHQAVKQVQRGIRDGHRVAVDLDLEKFFDRVDHDLVMNRLGRRVTDQRSCG